MRITRWDQELDSDRSNEVLLHLAQWHFSQLSQAGAATHSALSLLIGSGKVREICLYDLSVPAQYDPDFFHLRQILAFFQKRVDIDIGVDRRAVAWADFVQAETECRETNRIFRKYARGGFYFLPRVESVLYRAQRKIAQILGDLPSLCDLKLRFGPGATTTVKKKDASARRKLSSKFACSEEATGVIADVLAEMPGWCGLETDSTVDDITVPVHVHRGRVRFVPKNAKTDRTIGVEPMLNQMVQLGIGSYIEHRLRLVGVDIRDQSRNQRLACEGSITGALATLDLQMASSLMSKGLVESLLPYEWWNFLRSFRTGVCESPDGVLRLEQFSSMGNGFTFPLQTLIFYAVILSCVEDGDPLRSCVSAYGDDLIVPTNAVPAVIEALTAIGFRVNMHKSYWSGPFRESCGKDYLSGIDVRPLFIKGALSGIDIFRLHNHYARMFEPGPCALILQYIDESLRIWGPDGYGDGHLIGDYSTGRPKESSWGGVTFETYTFRHRKAFYSLGADYVYPSYSIYLKDGDGSFPELRALGARLSHFRPERSDAEYVSHRKRVWLSDTLPGVNGYKRIKIYTFGK